MQGTYALTPAQVRPGCGIAHKLRSWRSNKPCRRFHGVCLAEPQLRFTGRLPPTQQSVLCQRRVKPVAAAQAQDAPETEDFQMAEQDDSINPFTRAMGMGTWRLKGAMDPPFAGLTAQIEGLWRHMIDRDLRLHQMDKKYKFLDSMDPDQAAGPWGYAQIQSPPRGDPKWPRMQVENRCYESTVFRKLHLELAHRQDDLQVIHCVMYPRVEYNLPILSFDMVGKDERVSLVCIDACPVAMNRSLPPIYVSLVRQLQERYNLANNRSVPSWGKEIFSDLCIIMRPSTSEELTNFIKYTIALTQAHLQLSKQTAKIPSNESRRLTEVKEGHKRYAQQHLKNSSTRGVLTSAFTAEVADNYMQTVMFDGMTE